MITIEQRVYFLTYEDFRDLFELKKDNPYSTVPADLCINFGHKETNHCQMIFERLHMCSLDQHYQRFENVLLRLNKLTGEAELEKMSALTGQLRRGYTWYESIFSPDTE